jgi:hypothetical protein
VFRSWNNKSANVEEARYKADTIPPELLSSLSGSLKSVVLKAFFPKGPQKVSMKKRDMV